MEYSYLIFFSQSQAHATWLSIWLLRIFFLQDLIDKASSILVGNRSMVHRMQASVGIPVTSDSEDAAFSSFDQVTIAYGLFCGE